MLISRYLIGLLLLLSTAGHFALAEAEAILLLGNERKPPKYWVEDGVSRGIIVDMVRWIGEQSGQTYNIELYPWKRAYNMATAGRGGIIGLSMTQERLQIFDYSLPMFTDDMMLVVLKGQSFEFNRLEDLQGKRIAVIRGASFGSDYERGRRAAVFQPVETNSPSQGFHMMRNGRVDMVMLGPGRVGVEMVFESDPKLAKFRDQYEILAKPFVRDHNYIGFKKSLQMQSHIEQLNHYIKLGKESGAFDHIIQSYTLQPPKIPAPTQ